MMKNLLIAIFLLIGSKFSFSQNITKITLDKQSDLDFVSFRVNSNLIINHYCPTKNSIKTATSPAW